MVFSKEDKILIIKLGQLNGYTATVFTENSEPKTGQEQYLNELLYKLIILLDKPDIGLLCANYVV